MRLWYPVEDARRACPTGLVRAAVTIVGQNARMGAQQFDNPNYQGPFGNTLLHSAVASGDVREVERLLAAGADPRIVNRHGHSAITVAVIVGHPAVYHLLSGGDDHMEAMLDQALEATFPASDPVALTVT
jgi:ankyrin repeat protein